MEHDLKLRKKLVHFRRGDHCYLVDYLTKCYENNTYTIAQITQYYLDISTDRVSAHEVINKMKIDMIGRSEKEYFDYLDTIPLDYITSIDDSKDVVKYLISRYENDKYSYGDIFYILDRFNIRNTLEDLIINLIKSMKNKGVGAETVVNFTNKCNKSFQSGINIIRLFMDINDIKWLHELLTYSASYYMYLHLRTIFNHYSTSPDKLREFISYIDSTKDLLDDYLLACDHRESFNPVIIRAIVENSKIEDIEEYKQYGDKIYLFLKELLEEQV